jgi:hypothetical protein
VIVTPALVVPTQPLAAVQWDGSAEARTWILGAYGGHARQLDGAILVTNAFGSAYTLEPGVWVLQLGGLTPFTIADAEFRAFYRPA